jgi:hypothetical protein
MVTCAIAKANDEIVSKTDKNIFLLTRIAKDFD